MQQVDEWYPELIEVEERAKDAATLLFFVIDSQTRAVSSMVEIAFFAGENHFSKAKHIIANTPQAMPSATLCCR